MRVAELRSLIAQSATSSTINALDDASSPQAMAVNWLASNSFSETLPDERLLQRFALATFAFSTSNAAGLRKNRELSVVEWLSGPEEDECEWIGIFCTDSKQVFAINLAQRSLIGNLPPEWYFFKDTLQLLDVSNNALTGPIPAEYGVFTRLRWLRLNRNNLSGELPDSLGQLKSLMHLNVQDNNLSGPFPNEALVQMTGLIQARMYFNNFSGPLLQEVCDKGLSILQVDCVQDPPCTSFCF